MQNKRTLKKAINAVCEGLFAETVAAMLYQEKEDTDTANELLKHIVSTEHDFISRVSHPEPGMKAKVYYNKVWEDFHSQADEIADQIVNL